MGKGKVREGEYGIRVGVLELKGRRAGGIEQDVLWVAGVQAWALQIWTRREGDGGTGLGDGKGKER